MENFERPTNTIEQHLISINEVETGKPASILVFHGSDRLFVKAVPSEKFPIVFYADTPKIAATYPFGKYSNELDEKIEQIQSTSEYDEGDLIIGAKLLRLEDYNSYPFHIKPLLGFGDLQDYHLREPKTIAVIEKLKTDLNFRNEANRVLMAWDAKDSLNKLSEKDIVNYETGPLGSVKEYLVSAKNPAVFDFEGHTWGSLPDGKGSWLVPTRKATTEELRKGWDEWINNFFDKGHDVLIIKDIRDVGSHIGNEIAKPHTIMAVSTKADVEVRSESSLL